MKKITIIMTFVALLFTTFDFRILNSETTDNDLENEVVEESEINEEVSLVEEENVDDDFVEFEEVEINEVNESFNEDLSNFDTKNEGVIEDDEMFTIDENGYLVESTSDVESFSIARSVNTKLAPTSFNFGYINFEGMGSQVINVYPTPTSQTAYTYFNTGSSSIVPALGASNGRLKVSVAGYVGYINNSAGMSFLNANQVSTEYYSVNSAGSLIFTYRYYGKTVSITVGKQPSFLRTNNQYFSSDGIHFYTSRDQMLSDTKNGITTNSINRDNPYYNYHQYLSFRTATSLTSDDFLRFLNSRLGPTTPSVLRSKSVANQFITSQNRYGINAALEFSMALLESGYGTSYIAKTKNNLFGWGAVDSGPYAGAYKFSSIESGIDYHVKNGVADGYLDSMTDTRYYGSNVGNKNGGLNVKYASDPYWGTKIAGLYYLMDKDAGFKDYNKYTIGIKSNVNNQAAYFAGSRIYDIKNNYTNTQIKNIPLIIKGKSGSTLTIQSDIAICNNGDVAKHPTINPSTGVLQVKTLNCPVNQPQFAADYTWDKDVVTTTASGIAITGKQLVAPTPVTASKVTAKQAAPKKMNVIIEGATSNVGVSLMQVAVWSDKNGQDDIIWYDAVRQANGTYKLAIDVANHKNDLGKYQLHTYGTNGVGMVKLVAANTVVMDNYSVTASVKNNGGSKYTITTSKSKSNNDFNRVSVAVWSETGGQDDIKWYDTTFNSLTASVSIDTINHLNSTGRYYVHVYSKDSAGMIDSFLATSSFSYTISKANEISTTKTSNTTFKTELKNISPYTGSVEYAVWSQRDGQDDLKWYKANSSSASYSSVSVNLANHKNVRGAYFIHAYMNNKNGTKTFLGGSAITFKEMSAKYSISNNNSGSFDVVISNISAENGVSKILVPVWSEKNGQDDLLWYTAIKQSNGTYKARIDNINHNLDNGKYSVHIYGVDTSGYMSILGTTRVDVNSQRASVNVSNKTLTSFDVTVSNLNTSAYIVYVPVWSEKNGQDDLIWHIARKQSNGSYKVTINTSQHKNEFGPYVIHSYAVNGAGSITFLGHAYTDVSPIAGKTSIINTSSYTFDITVSDVNSLVPINTIYVPVWSEKNGQDDLKWYVATKKSNGTYTVSVNTKFHNYDKGVYQTHVYGVDSRGALHFIDGRSVSK